MRCWFESYALNGQPYVPGGIAGRHGACIETGMVDEGRECGIVKDRTDHANVLETGALAPEIALLDASEPFQIWYVRACCSTVDGEHGHRRFPCCIVSP
jgi:hypothetical protein